MTIDRAKERLLSIDRAFRPMDQTVARRRQSSVLASADRLPDAVYAYEAGLLKYYRAARAQWLRCI